MTNVPRFLDVSAKPPSAWLLLSQCRLQSILLLCCWLGPFLLSETNVAGIPLAEAQSSDTSPQAALVAQEFRYHAPEAGEVWLVWGINGWKPLPDHLRPPGTSLKNNSIMHTPMIRTGSSFVAATQVPSGSTIDFGFLITKSLSGTDLVVWDGNGAKDYHRDATRDGTIEVGSRATVFKMFSSALYPWLYLLAGIGAAWGIWLVAVWLTRTPKWVARNTFLFLVNVTAIAIGCFFAEVYLRVDGHKPYIRTSPGQYQNDTNAADYAQFDSVLGWTSKKDNPEMNQQGFRDAKDFYRSDSGLDRTRVLILGDSFMWGAGVGRDENVPNLLQTQLKDKYDVFNLSAPGWGIDQMYLAYQQYKDVLNPHIVILAFIDDDVDRVLEAYRRFEGYNKPSFAIKDGQLVLRPLASPPPSLSVS